MNNLAQIKYRHLGANIHHHLDVWVPTHISPLNKSINMKTYLCSMCYLELPRVHVNNRTINKTLQSLRNTCTRQITAYSKRKVTKLWEHFPRFNNSKRTLSNRKVFFRPRLPIDAKEEDVRNGLAWMLSLFSLFGFLNSRTLWDSWRLQGLALRCFYRAHHSPVRVMQLLRLCQLP